ncbi:MAG: hypothetical protein V3V00_01640 [Saprospiraceae bacterium]
MALATFNSLSDSSRVWIYRSDRKLAPNETIQVSKWIEQFINQWTAHNHTLKAHGSVYHDRFIVILLDEESSAQASGCSIDSQVRFVKDVGESLKIDFFDRLHFDFIIDNKVITIHKDEVQPKISSGDIDKNILVLNHLVKTKSQFINEWSVPLSESWHQRLI